MLKEFTDYLSVEFPEGVFWGDAPEAMETPYLTVEETSRTPDEAVSAEAARSVTSTFEVTIYAKDRNTLAARMARLRRRVDRVGEVFDLWGVRVGLMRIESEETTVEYVLGEGEETIVGRTVNVTTHYERI